MEVKVIDLNKQYVGNTPTDCGDSALNPSVGYLFTSKPPEFFTKDGEKIKGTGVKEDANKPDYSLLPPNALHEVVKALTFGAKEHDSDDLSQEPNWKSVPHLERRFFAAAQRHQWAWKRGEIYDSGYKGSGCHHLASAITGLLFVLEKELEKERNKSNLI